MGAVEDRRTLLAEAARGDAEDAATVRASGIKSKEPRFRWPGKGDDFKKRFNPEVATSAAILQALGADIEISPVDSKALREWLSRQSGDMDGLIAGGARSWNHPHLRMAARGLVFGDWGDAAKLVAMQSGRISGEGAARFLSGEEPRSTDYDPFRWAAYLIFRAKHPSPQARQDAEAVLRRDVALSALGAVPWTDLSGDLSNNRGELWHHGATLSPVGERSPKTSNPDALGLFERMTRGKGGNDREGFAGAVADIVGWPTFGDPDVATCLEWLAGVSVFGVFHFAEWADFGRLVWRPEQKNPNTPSALWSFAFHVTQRQIRGFPYPARSKNRGSGAPRSLGCALEGRKIIMRTTFGADELVLPDIPPTWAVIVDGDGARFEGEAPRERPAGPPPVGRRLEPIEPEVYLAATETLGAQDDQRFAAKALIRAQRWTEAADFVAGMAVPRKKLGDRDNLAARLRGLTAA